MDRRSQQLVCLSEYPFSLTQTKKVVEVGSLFAHASSESMKLAPWGIPRDQKRLDTVKKEAFSDCTAAKHKEEFS